MAYIEYRLSGSEKSAYRLLAFLGIMIITIPAYLGYHLYQAVYSPESSVSVTCVKQYGIKQSRQLPVGGRLLNIFYAIRRWQILLGIYLRKMRCKEHPNFEF
jgi:hypothetical protein